MTSLADAPPYSAREFTAVVLSTAGLFVCSSAVWSLRPASAFTDVMSSTRLAMLVATELVLAAYWLPRLRRRGWSAEVVTLPARPQDVLLGMGLFVYTMVLYVVVWVSTWVVWPAGIRAAAAMSIGGNPSWWAIVLVVVVNPIAEEFLYLGYVARSLEQWSRALALWACVAVRVATHLYQGPYTVISILPLGVVFGVYYLQNRRIWPIVVAHSIMDFVGLARLASAA